MLRNNEILTRLYFFSQSFIDLSKGLGPNTAPFRLAVGFAVARLVRNALNPEEVWSKCSNGYRTLLKQTPACTDIVFNAVH